jgi:hypothetical protein
MSKPWIQTIAERLDDLQPVNGSYIQAIAQMLENLPQTGGSNLYSTTDLITTSTDLVTPLSINFGDDEEGWVEFSVVGIRGTDRTKSTGKLEFDSGESDIIIYPPFFSNPSPYPVLGATLGIFSIFKDNTNKRIDFNITPNSATSTKWWIFTQKLTFNT